MRILLIEDDKAIAEYVHKGLREAGCVVDHVVSGEEGLVLASGREFDVAVIDVMLPGMDGFCVIEKMRDAGSQIPVLILSARQAVDDKVTGLNVGGDDYLTKPFSFAELYARLQALVRRASHTPQESLLQVADLSLDRFSRRVQRAGTEIVLHSKEYALLEYFMDNAGRVITKTMILERVWEYSFDPQTNVVEVLVHRLRSRIDKPFEETLLHTVRGVGYVLKAPETTGE